MGILFVIAFLCVMVAIVKVHKDVRVSAHSWHRRQARAITATYVPPAPKPRPTVIPINEDEVVEGIPTSLILGLECVER